MCGFHLLGKGRVVDCLLGGVYDCLVVVRAVDESGFQFKDLSETFGLESVQLSDVWRCEAESVDAVVESGFDDGGVYEL